MCIERRFSPLVRALSYDYRVFGTTHATLLCCLSLILVQEFDGCCGFSILIYAADLEAAADFIEEVVGSLKTLGMQWLILGDCNFTLDEGPMAQKLAAGLCHLLDLPFVADGPLPATARARRRIDNGLSAGQLFPFAVSHCQGLVNR